MKKKTKIQTLLDMIDRHGGAKLIISHPAHSHSVLCLYGADIHNMPLITAKQASRLIEFASDVDKKRPTYTTYYFKSQPTK